MILPLILDSFTLVSNSEISEILLNLPNKTSSLDPVPVWVVKQCASEVVPAITAIVNSCLENGVMPNSLKKAIVRPILKKNGLDKDVLNNYRPVSNLTFLSKIIEKVVASRNTAHLSNQGFFPKFQSAYRSRHSTETAFLRVHNNIVRLIGEKKAVMLILLDLSAAFDTIDSSILIKRLNTHFGIGGLVLDWLKSYLNARSMSVKVEDFQSSSMDVCFGVPQGSILGPLLYSLYTTPLEGIISSYSLDFHMYADDTQIYVPITTEDGSTKDLEQCLKHVKNWMSFNKLKLNESKTEVLFLSSSRANWEPEITEFDFAGNIISVPTAETVRNLGCFFDSHLSMESDIKKKVQSCHFHLRNIGKIRGMLDKDTTHRLVHAFITSHLDYCNSLHAGLPSYLIQRLQKIQNKAARLVACKGYETSSEEIRFNLHWLPIDQRVTFKIACLAYKCLNNLAPHYLQDLVKKYTPSRELRSSKEILLKENLISTCFQERAFSNSAPVIWNSLSHKTRHSESFFSFKRNLKTELFNKAYLDFTS